MNQDKLQLQPLEQVIASLTDALAVIADTDWFEQQRPQVQNTLMAGVIQNFEFVYEISTKMIRRQLEAEALSPEEVDRSGFRDILRTAAEKGLIDDVETWFRYRLMRNITSHTYNQEKAQQVYEGTLVFIEDARALLKQLEGRNA